MIIEWSQGVSRKKEKINKELQVRALLSQVFICQN
jgi:hypothetical protein